MPWIQWNSSLLKFFFSYNRACAYKFLGIFPGLAFIWLSMQCQNFPKLYDPKVVLLRHFFGPWIQHHKSYSYHRYPLTMLTQSKNYHVATNFLVANFQYFGLLAARGSENNKNCPSSFSNFSQKCG